MHIGKKIKIARITKGITQQELADLVDKTRPLISNIEQTGKVNTFTLQKICEVLGLTLEELETASEPTARYGKNESGHVVDLETEVTQLKRDVEQLTELVESQREIILLLKEKLAKKSK